MSEVRVLENSSDEDGVKYKLKVLEVVKKSSLTKPSEIGEEFEFLKMRDAGGCGGLGHLMDY